MLKGIPKMIPPLLLKVLCEMGHGDKILLADGNFPAESVGKNAIVVRCDGHGMEEMLDAVLQLFPLDGNVAHPAALMQVSPGDPVETPIWKAYEKLLEKHTGKGAELLEEFERQAFYEEAKKAYAIIATGEAALYANILLQKGVI